MRIYKPTRRNTDGTTAPYDKFYVELRTTDGRIMRLPGFANQRLTESLGRNVQRLIDCRASGEVLPQDTAKWIETLAHRTTEVLARWGLLQGHTLAAGGSSHSSRGIPLIFGHVSVHGRAKCQPMRRIITGK